MDLSLGLDKQCYIRNLISNNNNVLDVFVLKMQHPNVQKIQYYCAHAAFLQAQTTYHHWTIILPDEACDFVL